MKKMLFVYLKNTGADEPDLHNRMVAAYIVS